MPVIYVKLCAVFQPNGGGIDFFLLKWDHFFIFRFLCLIKSDSDRISTLNIRVACVLFLKIHVNL